MNYKNLHYISWIQWILHRLGRSRLLDQLLKVIYLFIYLKLLNLYAVDEGVSIIGLTWNFISSVIPHRSFHPHSTMIGRVKNTEADRSYGMRVRSHLCNLKKGHDRLLAVLLSPHLQNQSHPTHKDQKSKS